MNVRLSILLVLVLALIGGAVLITQVLSTREPDNKQPWMYKITPQDIVSISISHADKETAYESTGDQRWFIKDGNDTPVAIDKWGGKVILLSGPRSSRTLASKIDDPAKYGLDFPQTTVELVDRSGYPLRFHLGDPTPDSDFWYARLVDSEKLYTVPSVWGEEISKLATNPPYSNTPKALVGLQATDIAGVIATYEDQQRQYFLKGNKWVFRDGNKDSPLTVDLLAIPSFITTAPWESLIAEYESDDFSTYGLDSPTTKLEIITKDEKRIELHVGNATSDDNRRYARPVGSERLFTLPASWNDEAVMLVTEPLLLTSSELAGE